jgi:hypothetical protein
MTAVLFIAWQGKYCGHQCKDVIRHACAMVINIGKILYPTVQTGRLPQLRTCTCLAANHASIARSGATRITARARRNNRVGAISCTTAAGVGYAIRGSVGWLVWSAGGAVHKVAGLAIPVPLLGGAWGGCAGRCKCYVCIGRVAWCARIGAGIRSH